MANPWRQQTSHRPMEIMPTQSAGYYVIVLRTVGKRRYLVRNLVPLRLTPSESVHKTIP